MTGIYRLVPLALCRPGELSSRRPVPGSLSIHCKASRNCRKVIRSRPRPQLRPQIIALKGHSPAFLAIFPTSPIAARVCPHSLRRLHVGDVLVHFCSLANHGKPTHLLVEQKCKREGAQTRTFESIGARGGGGAAS
jgi:hypothetical protein